MACCVLPLGSVRPQAKADEFEGELGLDLWQGGGDMPLQQCLELILIQVESIFI